MAALGIVGLFLTLLVVVVYYSAKQSKAQFERQRQDRRLRTVADVQAGRGDVSVSDAELLEMLADDAQRVKTVTSVYFFMADLGDPRF